MGASKTGEPPVLPDKVVARASTAFSALSSINNDGEAFGRHAINLASETSDMAKTAFITGANGISGGAILEYLVSNTAAGDWSSIIVTSRSPFKAAVTDSRVEFIALDFTQDAGELAAAMRGACAHVTHAYFCSYVHKDDFGELNAANAALFENFVDALEQVAPKLENVTLQTGGWYSPQVS